ncbi:hypothetical protein Leryth_008458 [Lithospermum erythrorhizon]|nr:hypothetical protein Leryth_008458 [Lithospermum erythrorhizon]
MNGDLETLPDKSDGELETLSGKKMMNLSVGYEYDVESNARYSSEEGRRRFRQGRNENIINLEGATDRWVIDEGENHDERRLANIEKGRFDLNPPDEDENGLRRFEGLLDRRFRGNDELEGPQEYQRRYIEHKKYSASVYSGEGPSSNYSESSYGHREQLKRGFTGHRFDNREYSGDDRDELLRKIDELKDQLSRSSMADNHIQKNPHHLRNVHNHHYNGSEDWVSDSSSGTYRPFMQYPYPDHPSAPTSYMNQYAESSAYMNMHPTGSSHFRWSGNIDIELNSYNLKNLQSDHYNASEDRFYDSPSSKSRPFMQHLFPDQNSASASTMNHYAEPSPHINMHPTGRRPGIPNPYQRFLDIPHNALSYHYEKPGSLHPLKYGLKTTNMPQIQSENLHLHSRWASEVDSEVSSLAYHQRPRLQPITGSQHCRSIGGGAPFITCENCFESLQVPKRFLAQHGTLKKMRCGSCSSMIVVDISNKNFLVSIPEETNESTLVAGNDNIKLIEGNTNGQGHTNRDSLTFSSEDYDHSGYDFQSMDREPIPRLTNQQVFAESAGTIGITSTSEEVAAHNPFAASRRSSSPTESSMKGKPPPPLTGSSLQELFEYSNKYHRGNHFKNGNRISYQEILMPNVTASREKYIKDVSEATELELSSIEYGNTESSLDSGVPRKQGDQLRLNKPAEHDEDNVTVNGHLIPNQLIKKAEKVAGPIQPGNYWYDSRAGFWGIIGGPCLGIIPPSIEEFKYPMPENCAGGNTSVYVNGRELHQKDLSLLVSRGLPSERNRYYNIKISGRVIDEMTNEELDTLGNLAPTVSRVKRGFGMKAPKQQH